MTASHIIRIAAVVLATAALAAPAALARPALDQGNFSGDNAAPVGRAPVVEQIDSGVDWGSVALGAGIGGMVVLFAYSGATTYRRRHHHVPLAR